MVGTLEGVLAEKRRPQMDELSEWDRKSLGTFVRIEIPITDIYKLRKVAGKLRGLADRIDNLTRRTDLPIKSILIELKWEMQQAGSQIKAYFPEVFKRRFYSHGTQDYCNTTDSAESDT